MTRSHSLDTLAGSSAGMVQEYDLTGMLVQTVVSATAFVEAEAGGLLVAHVHGQLELLSATSHGAAELETYQALSGEGPCVECVRREEPARFSLAEVAAQWPPIAELMAGSGFGQVLATPLRWRGSVLGGLNHFWAEPPDDWQETERGAQVYSDLLTLLLVNSRPMSPDTARDRIEAALEERALIEQAKGVLAEQEGLDMAAAYQRLRDLMGEHGMSLTRVAVDVVAGAHS